MSNKKLLQSFVSFSIGPIGAALINFLTIPLTTWLVSPSEYGKTSIFLLCQTFATAVVFLGLDHSFMREYNNNKKKNQLLLHCLLYPLALSILIAIILSVYSNYFSGLIFGESTEVIVYLLAIWLPFMTIERFLLLNIRMKEKGLVFSIFNILIKFFILIFTLLFLLLIARTFTMIVAATVLAQIAVDIILLIYVLKKTTIKRFDFKFLGWDKKHLYSLLKYGLPFVPTAFLMWLLTSTDRIFLQKMTDFHELGIYFAAIKVIGVIAIFRDIFTNFWLPVAFRWKSENVNEEEFEKINHLVTIIMTLVFLLILSFKEVFVVILSAKYQEITILLPLLIIYPVMYTISEATGLGIQFSRKTNYNIVISTIAVIINITFNIIFIKLFGAFGAAISIAITYIVYFWIKTLISRKLWYSFGLKFYVYYTIFIIVIAVGNIYFGSNILAYVFNALMLVVLCIVNLKDIKKLYVLIAGYINRTKVEKSLNK